MKYGFHRSIMTRKHDKVTNVDANQDVYLFLMVLAQDQTRGTTVSYEFSFS